MHQSTKAKTARKHCCYMGFHSCVHKIHSLLLQAMLVIVVLWVNLLKSGKEHHRALAKLMKKTLKARLEIKTARFLVHNRSQDCTACPLCPSLTLTESLD
jgi:hypothetical protein